MNNHAVEFGPLCPFCRKYFFVPDTNIRFSLLRKKSKQLLNACIKYQPRRSINESKLQGPIPSSRNVLVLGTFVLCRLSLLVNEVDIYTYVGMYLFHISDMISLPNFYQISGGPNLCG